MNKATRHLDHAIAILSSKPRLTRGNMRPSYELAAEKQGWAKLATDCGESEWRKGDKRLLIPNGDKLLISHDGTTWTTLGQTARKRFLLAGQQ